MELALLDTLVVREDRHEVIKNGIRLQAWGPVITAVKVYTPVNMQQLLTQKRLKSRFDDLKRLWRAWVAIVALSGWSVDEDTGAVSRQDCNRSPSSWNRKPSCSKTGHSGN
jgi:hypothetical protein